MTGINELMQKIHELEEDNARLKDFSNGHGMISEAYDKDEAVVLLQGMREKADKMAEALEEILEYVNKESCHHCWSRYPGAHHERCIYAKGAAAIAEYRGEKCL